MVVVIMSPQPPFRNVIFSPIMGKGLRLHEGCVFGTGIIHWDAGCHEKSGSVEAFSACPVSFTGPSC